MFGKLVNGEMKQLKMPIRKDGRDIFTNDEQLIRQNGYKQIVFTEPTGVPEDYYWQETDDQLIQVWIITEGVIE